jgi:hypothetical protein
MDSAVVDIINSSRTRAKVVGTLASVLVRRVAFDSHADGLHFSALFF